MKKFAAYILAALVVSGVSVAKDVADRSLPFVVESDAATYADITQTSVFTGRVILTQGTIRIEADQIETIVDPEGYQFATGTMTPGKGLVQLEQKREGTNEIIKGQAKKLIYDGKQNLILLSGQAQMRRLTPSGRLIDKIDADELVYNQLTEVFESHAQPNATGRTRVIITPNSQVK